MLHNFKYVKLKVRLKALEDSKLPSYLGSTLRGTIGHTLKKVSCINPGTDCKNCDRHNSCVYSNVFVCVDTSNSGDMLNSINTAPNPFVIYSQRNNKNVIKKDDHIYFDITLLGKAVSYMHFFLHAISQIENLGLGANRKKFRVDCIIDDISGDKIMEHNHCYINNFRDYTFKSEHYNKNRVKIRFDTPLRVKENGKFTQNISFEVLIKNIMRRASMIYQYHMDEDIVLDIQDIINKAKQVKTEKISIKWNKLNRYSSRVQKKMSIGGVTGTVIYKGPIGSFVPLLSLGEIIHVGKGCTVGLGHYSLS